MTKPFPGQKVPLPNLYDIVCNINFLQWIFIKNLAKNLNLKGNETIADIGSGSGALLARIKKQYPATTLIGIDPDEAWIGIANKKSRKIKFIVGEGANIPIKSQSVDIVLSTLALHHMDDDNKNKTLEEMKRITKKGGRIIIADIDKPKTMYHKFVIWTIMFVENPDYIKINLEGKFHAMLKKHFPNIKPFGRHLFVTIWETKQ